MWTCKPQDGVPGSGVMSGGLLDRYLCVLGSGVGSHQLVTSSGGACYRNRLELVTRLILLSCIYAVTWVR